MSCARVYDGNCHNCLPSSTARLEAMLCLQASCAASKTRRLGRRLDNTGAGHSMTLQCPRVMAVPMSPLLGSTRTTPHTVQALA